jgi:peroxiredoxin
LSELAEKMKVTAVGQVFTDFEMETPDGKSAKLSDYAGKGKVVLVDFWASWCGPCRSEMPRLIATYEKYKSKGFEIVGVSLDADRESWKNGIEQLGITWPQISDLKYWNSEGGKLYGVRSIPHTVLIDKDGTIVARGLQGVELQQSLDQLLEDSNN